MIGQYNSEHILKMFALLCEFWSFAFLSIWLVGKVFAWIFSDVRVSSTREGWFVLAIAYVLTQTLSLAFSALIIMFVNTWSESFIGFLLRNQSINGYVALFLIGTGAFAVFMSTLAPSSPRRNRRVTA
jgi:hypothetical protein